MWVKMFTLLLDFTDPFSPTIATLDQLSRNRETNIFKVNKMKNRANVLAVDT